MLPIALAPHRNLAGTPVDVGQQKTTDLAGTQPESGE
jgi:hypothetical protein